MQFQIDNMTCGGCARAVTAAIRGLDPAASVRADPPARRVDVDTTFSEAELRETLTAAGFPPR